MYPSYIDESRQYASYVFHELAKEIKRNCSDVRVLVLRNKRPRIMNVYNKVKLYNNHTTYDCFDYDGIKIYRLPLYKLPKIRVLKYELERKFDFISKIFEVEKYKPEILVLLTSSYTIYFAKKWKERFGIPVVLSLHNSDVLSPLISQSPSFVDYYAFSSHKIEKKYLNYHDIDSTKYSVLNFGIEKKEVIDLEQKRIKVTEPLSIISVGRLIPLKNFDILIKAISLCKKDKICLEIYGEGPERKKIERLIYTLGMDKNISLMGEVKKETLLLRMQQADVFVLVSSPETLGIVYLEAMGKGCITIGSKREGIDGIIEEGKNGFLCEPKDYVGLSKMIEKIYFMDYFEKYKIIKETINTAREYTNSTIAKKYLELSTCLIRNKECIC